jgi:hypothetical protein
MTTAWSHLPNAAHIDRVLTDLKSHTDTWKKSLDVAKNLDWTVSWSLDDGTQTKIKHISTDAAWKALEVLQHKKNMDYSAFGQIDFDKLYSNACSAASEAAKLARHDSAMLVAVNSCIDMAWVDLRNLNRDDVWRIAKSAANNTVKDVVSDAGRDAIMALIAWDDSSKYLDMPSDKVRLMATLGDHKAILMLPAVLAFEKSKELA